MTRRRLYELVWSKPVEQVATEFGLSGRGLGKLCERNGVPVPPRGYWARKAAGQKVVRPRLIDLGGSASEHRIPLAARPILRPDAAAEPTKEPFDPYAEMWRQQVAAIGELAPPAKLSSRPHRLVVGWLEQNRRDRQAPKSGLGRLSPIAWEGPLERRKLRILDVTMKTFEAMGLTVEHDPRRGTGVFVKMGYDEVEFRIYEPIRTTRRRLTSEEKAEHWNRDAQWRQEREATGALALKIVTSLPRGVAGEIRDGEKQIEYRIAEFVAAIVVTLAFVKDNRELYEVEQRRRREAQERAHRIERERQAELARKATLRAQAASWREAALLREYVAAARAAAATGKHVVPAAEFDRWAAWALAHADEIDPISGAPDRPIL